jgi:IS5 family transposase
MSRLKVGVQTLFDASIPDHRYLHEFDHIDALLDWTLIEALLDVIHNAKEGGASYPPIVMFRALLMQTWHGLSDVQTEKMLCRDLVFRRFCRLSVTDSVPDHSTISRFRSALIKHDLIDNVLGEVNRQLAAKGAIITQGEVSIIDATVIEAHQCRKKPGVDSDNTQDPEAGWSVKKGSKGKVEITYGFKAHTNCDEDGFGKKLDVTAGNIHDSKVFEVLLTGTETQAYADSAYRSGASSKLLKAKKIKNCLHERAYRATPLTAAQIDHNQIASSVRFAVEQTFGCMKRHYGAAKTRFLGCAKTKVWILGDRHRAQPEKGEQNFTRNARSGGDVRLTC